MLFLKFLMISFLTILSTLTMSCGEQSAEGSLIKDISRMTTESVLGQWYMGGPYNVNMPCFIAQEGDHLVVMNENGDKQRAEFLGADEMIVPGWNNLRGKIVQDPVHQGRIDWGNGTWWIRYQAKRPQPPAGKLCVRESPDFDHLGPMLGPICRDNVSQQLRDQVLANYHITSTEARFYTVMHYFPLEIGGSNDIENLWPLPIDVAVKWNIFIKDLVKAYTEGSMEHMEVMARIWNWEA